MKREEILTRAAECVCGKRHEDYVSPEDNFKTIAMCMALLKIARVKAGGTLDCYVDMAGYAACAGEIVEYGED